jgi:hypothetical protein
MYAYLLCRGTKQIQGSFDSNDYGNPYQIAGPSAWSNSVVAVSSVLRGINKIYVWWIGPSESGDSAARPNTQNRYVYWNSSADRQWKGARAINLGDSIRGGLAASMRTSNEIDVLWIGSDNSMFGTKHILPTRTMAS